MISLAKVYEKSGLVKVGGLKSIPASCHVGEDEMTFFDESGCAWKEPSHRPTHAQIENGAGLVRCLGLSFQDSSAPVPLSH